MKTGKTFILFFTLLLFAFVTNAQEYVTGLSINEQVAKVYSKKQTENNKKCGCSGVKQKSSLQLPFFDDFTYSKVVPDNNKWVDDYVYINQGFPFRSVNHGVATLDVLDNKGKVYEDANWVKFTADYLTSVPIRTDSVFSPAPKKLDISDSLYFSFFYQPQGRGDEPEAWDSLILQFAYRTGDTVFDYMDSIDVLVDYYTDFYNRDTIFPGDTLWAPPGCNPNVFTISYTYMFPGQIVTVPCDSVFIPETKWKTVWETEGMSLMDFQKKYKTNFRQVLIPLDTSIFFYDAFQFRFLNYASIANDVIPGWKSNCDQWNIDYVYLNYDRTINDTTYTDVSFTDRAPSFLKRYSIMPYKQYIADAFNSIAEYFKVYFSNKDSVKRDFKYFYKAERVGENSGYTSDVSDISVDPYFQYDFRDTLPPWQLDTAACVNNCYEYFVAQYFDLDYGIDSLSYNITHYIKFSDNNGTEHLDSIIYHQGFYNYFAYDDGIPELGYGLEPSGAECAYQFAVTDPDTLKGVQIYFNRTLGNANEVYFNLRVWRDNNGAPGQVAYTEENVKVKWNSDAIYGYYYYKLSEPVPVSGIFYVGWEQIQNGSLNVGFDANNDKYDKIFYTLDNTWHNSNFHGALMIRPVVGFDGFVGTKELINDKFRKLNIYPNPASDYFKFDKNLISQNINNKIIVYNMLGAEVLKQPLKTNKINISHLNNGLYIIKVEKDGYNYTSRLLINR